MPVDAVDTLVAAAPCAVAAALTRMLPGYGWTLTEIGGFGRLVSWKAFDADLELVELQAELLDVPDQPGVTRLRITRVDVALRSIERFVSPPRRETGSRPSAAG